jgi:mRNA-degrading endonuclease RelE of RelBE toxin-antitoxin system
MRLGDYFLIYSVDCKTRAVVLLMAGARQSC